MKSKKLTRTEGLRARLDAEWILISSPAAVRYLSGFTGSAALLLISQDEQYLITDGRYTLQAEKQAAGYIVVRKDEGLYEALSDYDINYLVYEARFVSAWQYQKIRKLLPDATLKDLGEAVDDMRMVKDLEELDKIRGAMRIADSAFNHILSVIQPGISEREVALELENFMRRKGASRVSFSTIVAAGDRSALPHAEPTEALVTQGDILLMDYGCVYNGYCSDITRTVIVGQPSDKQCEVYSVVLAAQEAALGMICEGIEAREIDAVARDVIEKAGYGACFSHALGHGVGIEVHEKPRVSAKGREVLREGMVITVEPGIYIPNFGGIRIEDMGCVTKDGFENFTKSPKQLINV